MEADRSGPHAHCAALTAILAVMKSPDQLTASELKAHVRPLVQLLRHGREWPCMLIAEVTVAVVKKFAVEKVVLSQDLCTVIVAFWTAVTNRTMTAGQAAILVSYGERLIVGVCPGAGAQSWFQCSGH